MTNTQAILERLEKLRESRSLRMDSGGYPMPGRGYVNLSDLDAAIADIRGYLQEPVTVWNDANAVPNNARDVLVRYQYADGTWRNCVSWWNGTHWVGKDDRVKFWCELPKPPDAQGGTDAK